jgi:septal ring factor EnvC (AmiA/AmiB activator)
MDPLDFWPLLAPITLALALALPKLFMVRSTNRRTDARTLAEAYGHVIDRLEKQTDSQGREIEALRDQVTSLMKLIGTRDQELAHLRGELTAERAENARLRTRVDQLERQLTSRNLTQ